MNCRPIKRQFEAHCIWTTVRSDVKLKKKNVGVLYQYTTVPS